MLRREQAREALAAGRRLRHVPEQERINSADIGRRTGDHPPVQARASGTLRKPETERRSTEWAQLKLTPPQPQRGVDRL